MKLTFSLKVSSLEAGRTVYSRPVKNKWPEKAREGATKNCVDFKRGGGSVLRSVKRPRVK